ncbi:PP2C family protein-serine/threonine phosphatase [Nocardioides sp. SYSU DS0651]|uniref:PP2C family protein-serine/threonine phosphatase n=1 Tax=Nocardioides sp. SYSU DS0651 TaxID=3415955 RepID=UPI003F4B2630
MTQLRRLGHQGVENLILLVLSGLVVAAIVGIVLAPGTFPFTSLNVPLLLGAITLGPRRLTLLALLVAVATVVAAVSEPAFTTRTLTAIALLSLLCLAVLAISLTRSPIGIGSRARESMLVDLRDRILAQGQIPELPKGWLVESALSSAGGSPFAGDFLVATTRERGRRLELAVVDVSGKGEAAGTRALQLSGAMGGLLGALPPGQFLPAANDYLLQRAWEEGFATAVHLSVDLATGAFELRGAGHPPPVQRHAGSGRWELLRTSGPVLGIVDDVEFDCVRGRLGPGDSLLLYTDGMVEEPRRDIDLGVDHMLGAAESLLRHSWDGLADRLVAAVGSPDDDRALLVVHRRP